MTGSQRLEMGDWRSASDRGRFRTLALIASEAALELDDLERGKTPPKDIEGKILELCDWLDSFIQPAGPDITDVVLLVRAWRAINMPPGITETDQVVVFAGELRRQLLLVLETPRGFDVDPAELRGFCVNLSRQFSAHHELYGMRIGVTS